MINITINRKDKTAKVKTKQKKRVSLHEFSKIMIVALTVAWFIGMIIGIAVVAIQVVRGDMLVNISDLLIYIGAPMTGGIVTYLLKSAYENKEKIKGSKIQQEDDDYGV